ncbi:MAG: ROK family protein [Elusimicrobiota bacterium]|jgi:glucokinase|nr:ROK family protein [Elusimicrobiota bacterium]
MNDNVILGIDIGGTRVKMAIINSNFEILSMGIIPTNIKDSPEKFLKTVVEKASELKNYDKVCEIGVGIPGDVDFKNGILRFSGNLGWKNIPIRDILHKYSKKKVYVDNDGNTASVGAFWLDTKGKANNLVCITLGTGVGGGIIIHKKLYRGASYSAGEMGHITIKHDDKPCNCGNIGCVEVYLGANHLTQYSIEYIKKHKSKIISDLVGKDLSKFTLETLNKAAIKKDKTALEIYDYAGEILGILFANVINMLNPDTIVLCGGLTLSGNFILSPAKKIVLSRAFKIPAKTCKIICSKWSDRLGVIGAAMLTKQETI